MASPWDKFRKADQEPTPAGSAPNAWDKFKADQAASGEGLAYDLTRAPTPEERLADLELAKRESDRQIVAGMSWPERQLTAFGENARHAIRQGSNLLTNDPTNEQLLEESRNLEALREAAPVASVLGGGSVAIPPVVALGAALPAGASLGATIGTGAALGAGQGAVFSDPGQRGKNAAIGFGLGTGIPLAAGLVSGAARSAPVPGFLKRAAESAAVRSTNADRTAFKKAFGRPFDDARISEAGRFLLDEGIPLRTPNAMREGLGGIIKQEGPQVGAIVDKATNPTAVDLWEATQNALLDPRVSRLSRNTEQNSLYSRVSDFLRDQLETNGAKISARQAHDLRRTLDDLSTWDQATPKSLTKAWRATRAALNEELDKAMTLAGLGDEWAASNARFGAAKTLKGLSDIGVERAKGNNLGSLTERLTAGTAIPLAIASGDPKVALAVPAFAAINRFGNPTLAKVADWLSRRASVPATATAVAGAPTASALVRAFLERRVQEQKQAEAERIAAGSDKP
jgi:hypothetical protein